MTKVSISRPAQVWSCRDALRAGVRLIMEQSKDVDPTDENLSILFQSVCKLTREIQDKAGVTLPDLQVTVNYGEPDRLIGIHAFYSINGQLIDLLK
jgi:hypothetical protein